MTWILEGMVLGSCMMAISRVVGMEMNKRILEGAKGEEEIGHLWDKVL